MFPILKDNGMDKNKMQESKNNHEEITRLLIQCKQLNDKNKPKLYYQ